MVVVIFLFQKKERNQSSIIGEDGIGNLFTDGVKVDIGPFYRDGDDAHVTDARVPTRQL